MMLANPTPIIDGDAGYLKNYFIHYNFSKGIGEWFERHNRYSSYEAIETMKALKGNPVQLGRLFSREELIARALGDDFEGSDRTIDAHVKNLRQKIETDPHAPRYIHTVHGIGYRFSIEELP